MVLFAVSDAIWVAIIVPVVGILHLVVQEWLASRKAKRETDRADKIAERVAAVKKELELNTSKSEHKLEQIHTLTNGAMGAQLRAYAEVMRWKADTTKKEEDEEAAVRALQMFQDHERASALANPEKEK